jgi:signal transduction histidine kinase/CheY-like chemotaxis protein
MPQFKFIPGRRLKAHLNSANSSFIRYIRIWLLLTGSIVLIVLTYALLSRSLGTLNNGVSWVAHTEHVRFQLAQVFQSMNDLGSGVSAYELTHDAGRFEPAVTAAAAMPNQLAALQQLVSSESAERTLVARLVELARQRQSETEELRARALRGDVAGVKEMISRGEGRRVMDEARLIVDQMQATEKRLVDYHREETRYARNLLAFGVGAAAMLAIVLLIAIAVVTVRHAERQRKLQNELAATLRRTSNALREADRRKDVFLATLSHELRNPLAPIRTATRVLESPELSAAELERSRLIISRQLRQMASLLDDLLDISRITRGVLTLKNEFVDLRGVLEAAVETAQPAISAQRHLLQTDLPAESITLEADPVRLTQIVANLLVNAAKYTDPEGRITLGAYRNAENIVISVRDTGIGIAPEMLPNLFEMFLQGESGREHADGGLGIGLALVKGFVELHGGRVEARSGGRERGSEFLVYLPASLVRSAATARVPVDTEAAAQHRRANCVLVADDNHDGAEIMGMLLKQSGYRVHVAHTGPDALAMAAQHRPDVAVLDIGMPGMSGYEVAERIRAEAWGAEIHLIAVTGWGQDEDKRKAERAGFDHHLTKPIDPERLERLVSDGRLTESLA